MRGRAERRAGLAALVLVMVATVLVGTASGASAGELVVDPQLDDLFEAGIEPAEGEAVPGEFIVTVASAVPDGAVDEVADELAVDADGEVLDTFTRAIDGFVLEASEADAATLLEDPRVEAVAENGRVSVGTTQTTTGHFTTPGLNIWGLDRMSQPYLPLEGTYTYPNAAGSGVEVYVVDTGIRAGHQELSGRATAAYDASPSGHNNSGVDCHGHGTHVAGTVGGSLVGVAKAVTITGVRVLDCNGDGTDASVIAGLNYAIGDHSSGPAVANLSIGGGASTVLDDALQSTIDDGITVVVAAGNEDTDACLGSPARAPNAITVGATDVADVRADFSNFGTCLDLYAPGVEIVSSWYTSNTAYAISSGTSMASPHVAGAAALYLQANPSATPAQVTSALLATAVEDVLTDVGTGSPNRLLYSSTTPLTESSAPTNLVATPCSGQVSLTWAAPSSPGNTAIRSYRVYRDGGTTPVHQTANGSTLTFTDTGRTNGVSYSYTVRAVNAVGNGAATSAVNATPTGRPCAPTGLTATPGDGQIGLSWTAPASNGGSAITSYRVFRDGSQVHETADGSALSFTDTSRTNGVQHSYQVAAVNGTGEGSKSSPAVLASARTTPGAPTGVGAAPGNTQVTVTWTAPSSNGGSAITAYQVLRDGSSTPVHTTANGSTLSFTDTGRTNGVSYSYVVRAVNAAGTGPQSSPPVAATPRTTPGAPQSLAAIPADGQIALTWAAPSSNGGAAVTAYRVFRDGSLVHTTADGSTFSFADTGRTNGAQHSYQVAAVNVAGEGSKSTPAVLAAARTIPGAPTDVQAIAGDESVTITWSAPSANGGSAITAYQVLRDGDPTPVHTTANGSTFSFTDTGLTNGTSYDYEVVAVNVVGPGPASSPAVSATPLDLPGAPTGVVVAPDDGQVEVSWTAPVDTGGLPIVAFRVFRDGSQVHETADGSVVSFIDVGRTNGTSYGYEVAAVTSAGQGPKSSPVVSATPRTVPDAPVLSATAGDEQVALTWTAPADGGSAITSYVVYVDGVEVFETANGTTLAHTVTGLANGTAYELEVAAVNAAGEGLPSNLLTRTPVDPPSGPTFVDVGTGHPFYADIEWMAAEGISTGYQPGPTYRPSATVTRSAMSAFMYRLAGEPSFSPGSSPRFRDVGTSHPFFLEVEWMAAEAISTGYADGTYRPGDAVTRQSMSAFMYRLAGEPPFSPGSSPRFSDVRTSHPFYAEVEWMAAEAITEGYSDGTFKPSAPVSRQAMSAFMRRMAEGPGVDLGP